MQDLVLKVPIAPYVIRYALRLAQHTRKNSADTPDYVRDYVTWGAGPRASQYLVLAAKARAVLHGRPYVACEDIRAVAAPVLRHRILTNFNAEADGMNADAIVQRLIESIPREREGILSRTATLRDQLHRRFAHEDLRMKLPAPTDRGHMAIFIRSFGIEFGRVAWMQLFA